MRPERRTSARGALGGGCDCSRSRLPACVRALGNGRDGVRFGHPTPVIDTAAPGRLRAVRSVSPRPSARQEAGARLQPRQPPHGQLRRLPLAHAAPERGHRLGADGGLLRLPRRPARSAGRARDFGVSQVPHAGVRSRAREPPADQGVRRQAARRASRADRHQRLHDVSHGAARTATRATRRRTSRSTRCPTRTFRSSASGPRGRRSRSIPTGPTNMAQCVVLPPGPRRHRPGPADLRARSSTCNAPIRARRATPSSGTAPRAPPVPDMQSCYRCHGLQHQGQGDDRH